MDGNIAAFDAPVRLASSWVYTSGRFNSDKNSSFQFQLKMRKQSTPNKDSFLKHRTRHWKTVSEGTRSHDVVSPRYDVLKLIMSSWDQEGGCCGK